MSHELRTPMNGIMGMTELLKMEDLNEEQMKLLDFQTEAEIILMNIIDELLNLEKIEKDLIKVENKVIDLREILKTIIVKNDNRANKKSIKVTYIVDERIPNEVIGDEDKIGEILNQLLSNAIKFTSEGSIISEAKLLSENERGLEVEFSVKDTGIGIEEKDREKLFLPFVQGDSSYTKRFQGIGLGIVICKKIVEAMGGKIWYETEKDIGTTFYFKLLFKKSFI